MTAMVKVLSDHDVQLLL